MSNMGNTATIIGKSIATLLLMALCLVVATSITPIYNFAAPQPFSGNDIFNPYRNIDSTTVWQRANFHTHTLIQSPFNECDHTPAETVDAYNRLGYDIVALTNHNYITEHPIDKQHVSAYEHGYNLLKYHKVVFDTERVMRFDHLLPILASQRQWQLDILAHECDFMQLNHPLRTPLTSDDMMRKLSGYMIMELDSGRSTECEYWDVALSAGHYSFGLANDDLHYPDRSDKIARRCSFLASPTATWEDICRTLKEGAYYSMRIPDYGNGDWRVKYAKNRAMPRITAIGITDNTTIYMALSESAERVVVYSQDHRMLRATTDADSIYYTLPTDEPYARLVAYFSTGEVIYTNPFARYDKATSNYPTTNSEHSVNITLTILYNLFLVVLFGTSIVAISKLWHRSK